MRLLSAYLNISCTRVQQACIHYTACDAELSTNIVHSTAVYGTKLDSNVWKKRVILHNNSKIANVQHTTPSTHYLQDR